MYKSPKTNECVDINECRGIPNICAMGTCVNTIGSYHCECGSGRIYNPAKFECSGLFYFILFLYFGFYYLFCLFLFRVADNMHIKKMNTIYRNK